MCVDPIRQDRSSIPDYDYATPDAYEFYKNTMGPLKYAAKLMEANGTMERAEDGGSNLWPDFVAHPG